MFLCCTYLNTGLLVAGTASGEVWCWSDTALCARFRAHDGPIFCLETEASEGWLFSGGKDGRLRLWSPDMFPQPAQRAGAAAPETSGSSVPAAVRMLDLRRLAVSLSDSAGRPRLLGTPCVRSVHWVGTSGARTPCDLPMRMHSVLSRACIPCSDASAHAVCLCAAGGHDRPDRHPLRRATHPRLLSVGRVPRRDPPPAGALPSSLLASCPSLL